MITHSDLHIAYSTIIQYLRQNTVDKELLANFEGTEARCVKALLETCKADSDIAEDLKHILSRIFPVHRDGRQYGGMITQGPITVNSHCPHHLYPVRYSAYVSYLPDDGQVLGLSKLARICKLLGGRPVLHEQLANDIADTLCASTLKEHAFPALPSKGSAVMLVGTHMCMSCRGVKEDAKTAVIELRGNFWEDGMENKFYQAVHSIKTGNTF
jgi:GTP cyclohydrolase I